MARYREYEVEIRSGSTPGSYEIKFPDFREGFESKLPVAIGGQGLDQAVRSLWAVEGKTRDSTTASTEEPRFREPMRSSAAKNDAIEAEEWGQALYRFIKGELLSHFLSAGARWQDSEFESPDFRIVLNFDREDHEAPNLLRLPWETLHNPQNGFFALNRGFSIVRRIHSSPPQESRTAETIRLLVITSNVKAKAPISSRPELQGIVGAQARVRNLEVEVIGPDAFRNLRRTFRNGQFQILHFIGHGEASRKPGASTRLIFEGREQAEDEIDVESFVNRIQDQKTLELVLLNSCHGASMGDFLGDFASRLAKAGIPATIAMQSKIDDEAAVSFTREFYLSLARGDSLDQALVEGRQALLGDLRGGAEWAKPVLYLQREVNFRAKAALIPRAKRWLQSRWKKHGRASSRLVIVLLAHVIGGAISALWLQWEDRLLQEAREPKANIQAVTLRLRPADLKPIKGLVDFHADGTQSQRVIDPANQVSLIYKTELGAPHSHINFSTNLDDYCDISDYRIDLREPPKESWLPPQKENISLDRTPFSGTLIARFNYGSRSEIWNTSELEKWKRNFEKLLENDSLQVIQASDLAFQAPQCAIEIQLLRRFSNSALEYQAVFFLVKNSCNVISNGKTDKKEAPSFGSRKTNNATAALNEIRPQIIDVIRRECNAST